MNAWYAPTPIRVLILPCLAGVLGLSMACAAPQPFQWVDEVPGAREHPGIYRIAPMDVISVRVWNQESMSLLHARVREDGRISLPFLKDVDVAGLTPNSLSEKLQVALVSFIVDPVVTVTVDEPAPLSVFVLGEVTTAGTYTLARPAGALQALAAAGGLTQYANRDGIYVLRRISPLLPPTRIRFRYRDLTSGGTTAAGFLLRSGDTIVVE